eukprot:2200963-Amphidinium_carterae.1
MAPKPKFLKSIPLTRSDVHCRVVAMFGRDRVNNVEKFTSHSHPFWAERFQTGIDEGTHKDCVLLRKR